MATDPVTSVELLVKAKTEAMKRELDALKLKKDDLIYRLSNTSFGVYEENTIEALARQDNVDKRLSQMIKKARGTITLTTSTDEFEDILIAKSKEPPLEGQLEIRTIINKSDLADHPDSSDLIDFLNASASYPARLTVRWS